jgi:disulfide bond formation protein DsbB
MSKKLPGMLFLIGLVSALMVLGFVIFLEYHAHLNPCSLCIFQRIAVMVALIVFLVGVIRGAFRISPRAILVCGLIGIVVAIIGLSISLRQIYLQSLPPSKVPACGPGLDFIFRAYPFLDALKIVFQGSGECAKVDWRGLGLSLADWGGIYFVILIILNTLAIGLNRIRKK